MVERKALGAKTALLAYAAGEPAESLRQAGEFDPEATRALVAATHPSWEGTASSSNGDLLSGCYPREGTVYAGSFPGIDIMCDLDVTSWLPSEFPARYLDVAAGRRVILHAMQSTTDTFGYAIWQNGSLVRSLCLSPGDGGIVEDIGEPLPFEAPYWAGGHPARPVGLSFHPLELGSAALTALFGFALEGQQRAEVDAASVKLAAFQVPPANPVTTEMLDEFVRTHKRTTYRMGPDGKLIKVET